MINQPTISIEDFNATFVEQYPKSETRGPLFEKYGIFLEDMKFVSKASFSHWFVGSYISDKLNPNDIDIINLIEVTPGSEKKSELPSKFFTVGGSRRTYNIDSYMVLVYPPNDVRNKLTELDLQYVKCQFFNSGVKDVVAINHKICGNQN